MVQALVKVAAVCTTLAFLVSPSVAYPKGKTVHIQPNTGVTIQSVLDAASPGDKIYVEGGVWEEQLSITKNGITLIGKNNPTIVFNRDKLITNPCTGLAGTESNADNTLTIDRQAGICIAGSDIVYVDQPFDGEHKKVQSVGTPVKDAKVSGFTVVGFNGLNIAILGAIDAEVKDNTVSQGEFYGMLTVGSKHTDIKHNVVTPGGFIGICMDDISDVEISHNDVSGYFIGLCVQTDKASIHDNTVHECCHGAFVDPGVKGVSIRENHFSDTAQWCDPKNGLSGIALDGAVDTVIRSNTFTNLHLPAGQGAGGVVIFDDVNQQSGAVTIASGNDIEKNVFSGNDVDVAILTSATNTVVKNNKCGANPGACA